MPARSALELFAPFFENLTDPRMERTKRHSLLDIIILAVCGTLGNADGWADIERFAKAKIDFFRSFLDLPSGIPSHDTFGRVFARLEPAALMACIQQWLDALGAAVAGEVVAIDGKTLRGSFDTAAGQNPLHVVSAWACDARLTLGQVAVDAKSNEITAIPLLLELLDLKDCLVTIDAMGCQKDIAVAIRAREADYVLAVKDNQPDLHQTVHEAFMAHAEDDFSDPSLKRIKTVERSHGRQETREYFIAEAPPTLVRSGQWKDVRSIGMVTRTRVVNGAETDEIVYYVSSLPPKVRQFAKAVRGHWGIENRLHWSLDVTFAEDHSRVRKDHSPLNLSMLRRLALSILRKDTTIKDSLRGKRLRAGWDDEVLLKIVTGFSRD
ncbi:MAG TPA: ISAs1 family transposase [Gemmataceae bacterium]|jgi:predicted transposase YbfD/YdcC|nr:ISAs1 family transposase [Gemmataceae bacterium]